MMKTRHFLLLLVCTAIGFTACKKNSKDNFDASAQFTTDTTAIRAFVVANKIPAVKDAKSGIFYQIITPGAGSVSYSGSTNVTVNYTGKLLNGTIFDTTAGTAVTFPLGGLIQGWQIGIPLIQPGGRIRLIIPSGLGYGNGGGGLPANSVLDFTIDVIKAQ